MSKAYREGYNDAYQDFIIRGVRRFLVGKCAEYVAAYNKAWGVYAR